MGPNFQCTYGSTGPARRFTSRELFDVEEFDRFSLSRGKSRKRILEFS